MGKFDDLTGRRFGKLVVIRRDGSTSYGKPQWLCRCDCGNTKIAAAKQLKNGDTKSCGCAINDYFNRRNNKGGKKNPYYKLWRAIKVRCMCETDMHYQNYGGRGIKMADEWQTDFWSFYEYISKLNGFGDKNRSIDRIDNSKGYEPGNVRWATSKEQARNKRNNFLVTAFGKTKSIAEWADEYNISYATLHSRITKQKWDAEKALTTPIRERRKCTAN